MPLKTIFLVASVLLNITLAAFIITGETRKGRPSGPPFSERSGGPGFERLGHYQSLTDEERQTIRDVMRQRLPEIRDKRRQAHEANRSYSHALGEQSFDVDKIKTLSNTAANLRRDQQLLSQEIMIEAMATLPDEKRKLLMEERKNRHEKRRGGGRKRLDHRRERFPE